MHTFFWGPAGIDDRRALADGVDLWPPALALADRDGAPLPGRRFALCEYVRDDDPEQFVADVDGSVGGSTHFTRLAPNEHSLGLKEREPIGKLASPVLQGCSVRKS